MTAAAALAALAVGLPLFYSRFGLMALDQSIVFDGGWRLLSGQRPFVDFYTPVGLVPSAMQAVMFGALGVSWLSYALHAALVNALFAGVTYAVIRDLGAGFWPAWLVGLGGAVVFYPPFAVPYMDQHSFFFSACCLWAALRGLTKGRRWRWAIAAAPTLAALAVFSKHIPAAFLALPALSMAIAAGWRDARGPLLTGLAIPIIAPATYGLLAGVSWQEVHYYAVTLPFDVGTGRVDFWPRAARQWRRWWQIIPSAAVTLTIALWAATAALVVGAIVRRVEGWLTPIGLALLSVWMLAVTAVFIIYTNNELTNGVALIPLTVGLAWLAGDQALRCVFVEGAAPRALRVALAVLVAGVSLVDLWRFDTRVNLGRHVHGGFDWAEPRWSPPPPLDFLELAEGDRWLEQLSAYITRRGENFLLFGDATILHGTTGRPSVFPALFIHPGLTIPPQGAAEFDRFEQVLMDRMRRFDVRYVVEHPDATFWQARLSGFRRVWAQVEGCPQAMVGGWIVTDVCR